MGKLMPSGISRIGFWLALSGALLFSTKAIWVKLAYRDTGIDAVSLLLLRMLFRFHFTWGFLYGRGIKTNIFLKITDFGWVCSAWA